MAHEAVRQGRGDLQSVMSAQSRAQSVGADPRRRAVVAEKKAATADDRIAPGDARGARRAGSGDDETAIGAAMRAETGGDRVIDRADAPPSRKGGGDAPRFLAAGETGQADAERDPRPIRRSEAAALQRLRRRFAHHREAALEVDIDIGRRPLDIGESCAGGVAQTRTAARRAAIDAQKEIALQRLAQTPVPAAGESALDKR